MLYKKHDKLWIGIVAGALAPLITIVIVQQVRAPHIDFFGFISVFYERGGLAALLSLCVIPDAALFFLALQFNYHRIARAILGMTIVYTCIDFIIKFAA